MAKSAWIASILHEDATIAGVIPVGLGSRVFGDRSLRGRRMHAVRSERAMCDGMTVRVLTDWSDLHVVE